MAHPRRGRSPRQPPAQADSRRPDGRKGDSLGEGRGGEGAPAGGGGADGPVPALGAVLRRPDLAAAGNGVGVELGLGDGGQTLPEAPDGLGTVAGIGKFQVKSAVQTQQRAGGDPRIYQIEGVEDDAVHGSPPTSTGVTPEETRFTRPTFHDNFTP